jgi:3' terminal RNA ribose 2'-O-methyltransferase Hen1
VLLTVSTTHTPATDLGYLLVKHPDRVHRFDLPTGSAYVCFPEATAQRCTAALVLDVDSRRLATRRGRAAGFALQPYVNDRPYAASSLLAAALNRAFRSALRGESKERPQLAATPIPLQLRVPALPARDGRADLVHRLFAPLGWTVASAPIPLDGQHPEWGASDYVDLTLTGTLRLSDALNHLYVLLPVLDDAKHYWVALDEVDKLLRAGEGWLADHPERRLIARRYLAHRRSLAEAALTRLVLPPTDEAASTVDEPSVKLPLLAERRRAAVLAALARTGASRVLDLGCGSGALLADLVRQPRFTEVVGVDVDSRALELAERRLRLDRLPQRQRERVKLWQGALTYADDRLRGFDAAVLMEVVEHLDLVRLPALEAAVFGHANPATVVVTTPNAEYNVRYPGLPAGKFRHHDHRFEWTRSQFQDWAAQVGERYGYQVELAPVGDTDPQVGAPTQLAVFRR